MEPSRATRRGQGWPAPAVDSQPGGVIQEHPGYVELFQKVLGQRLDTKRFGGVVAGIEDIQPQLFRVEKRPVWPLAGHIRVETRRSHLRNHRSTGSGHDPDALHTLRAKGHHSRSASEHGGQRPAQVVTRPSAFSPNAERRAVIRTELATDRYAEEAR